MSGGERWIGVFDSGMGGLTVLRTLRAALPGRSFLYLGDTARLPYGTKSGETVTHYALQAARALMAEPLELLVVACNTASSVALPALAEEFHPVPVVGVIEPGAAAGARATRNGHIAVLATESTVRGGAYVRAIQALRPGIRVTQVACSLFVALAEEGWTEGPVARAAAERYLEPLLSVPAAERPDTLVLGCTHFPVLRPLLQEIVGPGVTLVDSAATTAATVAATLRSSFTAGDGGVRYFVTDAPERFARVGSIFLGTPIASGDVTLIDLAVQ